jgi:hypothetical protein
MLYPQPIELTVRNIGNRMRRGTGFGELVVRVWRMVERDVRRWRVVTAVNAAHRAMRKSDCVRRE